MQFLWQLEDVESIGCACPVCGDGGPHRPVLVIPGTGPAGADWRILGCAACGTRFSSDRRGADYRGGEVPGGPVLDFYLEQGAGLRPMLEPLGFAEPGAGRRMLEIGGGYGFASDYVQQVLGWTAKGYDPSGLAALGREHLGLDIVRDYWTDDVPMTEPYDIAYASEVVEHIPEPGGFLASMRRAVGDRGVAVLTTPDGAALNTGTTPGMLAPIASPGLHLTLFSARGMEIALKKVGFKHVQVEVCGAQIRAYASDAPLPRIRPLDPDRYLAYLRKRMNTPGLSLALLSGLRYRLLKELVNAADAAAAMEQFQALADLAAQRFGINLYEPERVPVPPAPVDFIEWLRLLPGNITGLLYFRAVLANNAEGNPRVAARFAAVAALAGASLRAAILPTGMDDGETELLTMAATHLTLAAAIGAGADVAGLLGAIAAGDPDRGLLLPEGFRRRLRADICRDLRARRDPALLWQGLAEVAPAADELTMMREALRAGWPPVANSAFQAVEVARDAEEVRQALRAIWEMPHAAQAVSSIRHARKIALIRLVLLQEFAEARHLFEIWDDPSLTEDPSVDNALRIARSGSPGVPQADAGVFAPIEAAEDVQAVHQALRDIWLSPHGERSVATVRHARKLALIRLVLLGAFAEAEDLFDAWDDPTLADDPPVVTALAIAASAR